MTGTYVVYAFLGLIILVQWFTNKNLVGERDFYKEKAIDYHGGNRVNVEGTLRRKYMMGKEE